LRTAAGNKRATVKGRLEGVQPKNTISRNRKAKPAATPAAAAKPARQIVRGNFRPRNTMAKPAPQENPFGTKDQTKARNLEVAQDWLRAKGEKNVGTYSEGRRKTGAQSYARMTETRAAFDQNGNVNFDGPSIKAIELNRANTAWKNPARTAIERRRTGWISTSSPVHTLNHEMGHVRDPQVNRRRGGLNPWDIRNPDGSGKRREAVAKRVSGYAATSPDEFVAETYAGRRAGRKYDHEVMRQYNRERGVKSRNLRSQLNRKRKPA
jgi:hypothetical protein